MLNSGRPFKRADLIKFKLTSELVVRTTNHDIEVTHDNGVYSSAKPIFKRSYVTMSEGLQPDELSIEIMHGPSEIAPGVKWTSALRSGAFDYAYVTLDIGLFELADPYTLVGAYNWFYGKVSTIQPIGTYSSTLKIKSELTRLDIRMPRNVVQPGCLNQVYDLGCGLDRNDWDENGTVAAVAGNVVTVTFAATPPNDLYTEGSLEILTGDNTGAVRKIKQQTGSTIYLFAPFVNELAVGDSVRVVRGCARTRAACAALGNSSNFRGIPLVPVPETVL